jgi:hypothetical protein
MLTTTFGANSSSDNLEYFLFYFFKRKDGVFRNMETWNFGNMFQKLVHILWIKQYAYWKIRTMQMWTHKRTLQGVCGTSNMHGNIINVFSRILSMCLNLHSKVIDHALNLKLQVIVSNTSRVALSVVSNTHTCKSQNDAAK